MHTKKDIDELAENFSQCKKILLALGDENRQHMIYYYFDPGMKSFELLISVLQKAVSITLELPDRSNGDEDWKLAKSAFRR